MIKTMYNITKLITKRYVVHGAYMILKMIPIHSVYFNERRIVICLYMSLLGLKKVIYKAHVYYGKLGI